MVEVRRKDVKHLKITNSLIEFLRRETLEDYKNLRTLTIANSGLKLVEYGAVSENLLLESFNVTNNFIQDISSKTFPSNNNIKTISLSNNLFRSLSDFDINHFPHLHTLDISKNYLEYLPEQLLNKLDNSSFTLIAGNNPFKCDDWLSKSIGLCTLITKSKLQPLLINYTNVTSSANTEVKCIRHCHFLKCIPPFLCGIWLGIIIGNICKIKDLIYPKLMENKSTQYGKTHPPFVSFFLYNKWKHFRCSKIRNGVYTYDANFRRKKRTG